MVAWGTVVMWQTVGLLVEGNGVQNYQWQSVGLFGRRNWSLKPPAAVFETWAISFTPPLCPCLSEETLKSLLLCVYARGSKISHTGKCVTCRGLRVVVFISTPLILAPAAGADSRSGRARERRRAGSVDGSNVLAGSPRVYGRM